MENQTKINTVVGIIMILALIAGYSIVGNADLEPTHYCEERQIKAFCYSLSSTMKTCYTEMNKTGGKRCEIWKEIGIMESIQIPATVPSYAEGKIWECPPIEECIQIVK